MELLLQIVVKTFVQAMLTLSMKTMMFGQKQVLEKKLLNYLIAMDYNMVLGMKSYNLA